MDNMLTVASELASRAPIARQAEPSQGTTPNCIGHHVAAAVIGAVVLAELTMGRQRTVVVQVEPQLTVEVTDAPA